MFTVKFLNIKANTVEIKIYNVNIKNSNNIPYFIVIDLSYKGSFINYFVYL